MLPPSGTFGAGEGGSKGFRQSVDSIAGVWIKSLAEADWAQLGEVPSLKLKVQEECGWFVAQTLAMELNLARVCGLLVGASPDSRYRSFMEGASSHSYLSYLAAKYPAIPVVLKRRAKAAVALHDLVAGAWRDDREILIRSLEISGDQMVDMRPLGDPHRGGLRASQVLLDSGESLLFKPSSAAPARFLRRFSGILAGSSASSVQIPDFVGRRRYHWQKEVPDAPTPEVDPVAFGLGLGAAHFSSTADLHFENVTIKSGALLVLDCEAVMGGRPLSPGQIDLLPSDLSITALLPRLMSGGKGVIGPNWGFWGGNHRIFQGTPDFETRDDQTDRVKYIQSRRNEDVGHWDRQAVAETWRTLELVQDAFEKQLRAVVREADRLSSLVRDSAQRGQRGRVVMRPTQSYYDVLSRSSHPSNLLSWSGYARSIRSGLTALEASQRLSGLIDREVRGLLRGDIPAFWVRCDSDQLLGCPLASGVSQTLTRIEEASADPDRMAGLYRSDIASQLAAYVIDDLIVRDVDVNYGVSPSGESPGASGVDETFTRLSSNIERVSWPGAISSWVNVHETGTGIWRRERSGVDLYSGSPGTHLALLQSGALDAEGQIRRVSELLGVLDSHKFTKAGAFDGEAGMLYAIASARNLVISDTSEAALNPPGFHSAYLRIADLIEKDDAADVISGAAGTLAVLASLVDSESVELAEVRELGEQCVARLELLAREAGKGRIVWFQHSTSSSPDEEWHGGFAHGVAGIAWALRRWAGVSGDALAVELATAAEVSQASLRRSEFEWDPHRTAFSPQEGRSGWCYGADGVILAQLDSGLLADETSDPSWYESLVSSLSKRDPGRDLCLCHGRSGRLVLWSRLAATAFDALGEIPQQLSAVLSRDTGRIIEDVSGPLTPLEPPFSRWSSSLMLGNAGVLHALHSTHHSKPSVLLLEI